MDKTILKQNKLKKFKKKKKKKKKINKKKKQKNTIGNNIFLFLYQS